MFHVQINKKLKHQLVILSSIQIDHIFHAHIVKGL